MDRVYIIGRDEVPSKIRLEDGQRASLSFIVLPGVSCEVNLEVEIAGENAEAVLNGLYVCPGDERVTLNIRMVHSKGGSVSRQLFKGLVGGHARTAFNGLVVVVQDAQHTEALQTNHNLLLSDTAEALTSPQLEIYADDVKCSHGATVGRLNEDEQFYMRSRGISLKEAQKLQMMAFAAPVLEGLSGERREEINASVEAAIEQMLG